MFVPVVAVVAFYALLWWVAFRIDDWLTARDERAMRDYLEARRRFERYFR